MQLRGFCLKDLDSVNKDLLTVRDFIRWGTSRFIENRLFFGHGTDNAWDEAVQLVLHALHLPADAGAEVLDARLTGEERKLVTVVLATRIKERIPAAYLNGVAWFAGLRFKADERALIPRSPLAELIEQGFQPWLEPDSINTVLDLCTGGACIGIATAHYLPACQVHVSDISADALDLARINIREHDLEDRIEIYQSDLFSAIPDDARYDLIVSNPPYVDQHDYQSMPAEYRHEPALGLQAGHDGLDLVRRILAGAANYLADKGVLIVELGNSSAALSQAFPMVPFTWLEFARGGHGVFLLKREDLLQYAEQLA